MRESVLATLLIILNLPHVPTHSRLQSIVFLGMARGFLKHDRRKSQWP